jgi:hypothetical protein
MATKLHMKVHEYQTEGDISRVADFCLDSKDNLYLSRTGTALVWECLA